MKDLIEVPLTPEEELLNEIRRQPDYQQITVQMYSIYQENEPLKDKILLLERQVHQSDILNKRVDIIRKWKPVNRYGKCVGHENQGSVLIVQDKVFGDVYQYEWWEKVFGV